VLPRLLVVGKLAAGAKAPPPPVRRARDFAFQKNSNH
jgi:hypothetical protein